MGLKVESRKYLPDLAWSCRLRGDKAEVDDPSTISISHTLAQVLGLDGCVAQLIEVAHTFS